MMDGYIIETKDANGDWKWISGGAGDGKSQLQYMQETFPDITVRLVPKGDGPGALDFLRRASLEDCRIVSSGDLCNLQISESQANGTFFVDAETGLGWALVPWTITTKKDRQREADYFSRNNMMV